MRADSNRPSHGESTSSIPKSEMFLIPRSQVRLFLLKFTFMTLLGWIVGGIASMSSEKILLDILPPVVGEQLTWYSWKKNFSTVVFAVIFGADQAFVIHRYLSGWLWMLATSMGWLTANSISTVWINYISSIASSLHKNISTQGVFILGILSTCAYIISGVWMGCFQWFVLRRYTTRVWWWIFLPSVSFLLISVVIGLLSLVQRFIPEVLRSQIVNFSQQGLTALILGIIPAIGLCILKRNSPITREY